MENNHQWMLKQVGESLIREKNSLKITLYKLFINFEVQQMNYGGENHLALLSASDQDGATNCTVAILSQYSHVSNYHTVH